MAVDYEDLARKSNDLADAAEMLACVAPILGDCPGAAVGFRQAAELCGACAIRWHARAIQGLLLLRGKEP